MNCQLLDYEASSKVTYTSISSYYEEPSDKGSPRVVVYGYDGLPMHPVDPPLSDYVSGPEEPEQAPLSTELRAETKVPKGIRRMSQSMVSLTIRLTEEMMMMTLSGDESITLLPFPVPSPLTTSPTYAKAPLGFWAAEIRLRVASPLPSPTLLPTHHPLPSPLLPPLVDRREDIPEADIPPQKRLCLIAPIPRFEVGKSLAAVATKHPGLEAARTTNYDFADMEGAPTTLEGVNARVTELAETNKRDTQDLYAHLEDEQTSELNYIGSSHQFRQEALTVTLGSRFHPYRLVDISSRRFKALQKKAARRGPKLEPPLATIADCATNHHHLHHPNGLMLPSGTDKPKARLMLKCGWSTIPKTMEEAIEMANNLMDQKHHTCAECQNENKMKQDDDSGNNQNQQQSNMRQNTDRAYTASLVRKGSIVESLPKCSKCNYHHNGPCAPKCHNYNKVGHLAWDCRIFW
ncbi:hypothetical protein Tco_0058105 [Tanacetum coccineum]